MISCPDVGLRLIRIIDQGAVRYRPTPSFGDRLRDSIAQLHHLCALRHQCHVVSLRIRSTEEVKKSMPIKRVRTTQRSLSLLDAILSRGHVSTSNRRLHSNKETVDILILTSHTYSLLQPLSVSVFMTEYRLSVF